MALLSDPRASGFVWQMTRRDLTLVLRRFAKPRSGSIHEVVAVGTGYLCRARECAFSTREMSEVCAHVAANQWTPQGEQEPADESTDEAHA